ncbi:GntR family transcriptional regulator [Pararhodobacter sp. SW119]|uniref:GntR family transcriptional regulator n=1 Tax=Pararhodobacter sp. SW119 TaxID=2780075 RepID=UPI001ADED3B7|nr:GntR family transcriptional regulator [Pararhodobacter sp. SW119]
MSRLSLGKIRSEPMWDKAYMQLSEALFGGRFEPGSVLSLRMLAESFGTSVTPVRDAVSRLVAQGVLRNGPRNAAMVPDMDIEELSNLTLIRCELEGLAARLAASAPKPDDLDALDETLTAMRRLIADGELDDYLSLHRGFHFQIYAMSQNPLLHQIIENLWLRCGPILSLVVPDYVLSLKGTDRHIGVIGALRRRDAKAAEAEIVADVEEASRYIASLADEHGRIRRPAIAAPELP